ncbi:unnamed protein product [Arctogadus glacialis]
MVDPQLASKAIWDALRLLVKNANQIKMTRTVPVFKSIIWRETPEGPRIQNSASIPGPRIQNSASIPGPRNRFPAGTRRADQREKTKVWCCDVEDGSGIRQVVYRSAFAEEILL